jgi:5-methylcytosine-specific restriction endonuclease McrA
MDWLPDDEFWPQLNAYYRTPEWQAVRAQVFKRDGYRCRLCGKGGPLEAHHRSYVTWKATGVTPTSDCTTLCVDCHAAITSLSRHKHKKYQQQYRRRYLSPLHYPVLVFFLCILLVIIFHGWR